MERKLASIQEVKEIHPIEKADRIERIKVLGWNLVSKKGEFSLQDKCVYFEIDSMLPDVPLFEFIKKGSSKETALRLKTVKLRGVVSQGLAMPITILKEFPQAKDPQEYKVGDDVTDLIGITKWLPASAHENKSFTKGNFPHYVPKTDEMRIQSYPDLLQELQQKKCYISVKMDGSSATYSYKDGEFEVCSRNLALVENVAGKVNDWWKVANKLALKEKLSQKGNFAIQGELCGPNIQGNKMQLDELNLFVFNVYDIDQRCRLCYKDFIAFCKGLELKTVPIADDNFIFNHDIEALLKLSEGKYDGTSHQREGIVIRPLEETYSETLQGPLSCKVINNKFLLKTGE